MSSSVSIPGRPNSIVPSLPTFRRVMLFDGKDIPQILQMVEVRVRVAQGPAIILTASRRSTANLAGSSTGGDAGFLTVRRTGQTFAQIRPAPASGDFSHRDGDGLLLAHQQHQTLAARDPGVERRFRRSIA